MCVWNVLKRQTISLLLLLSVIGVLSGCSMFSPRHGMEGPERWLSADTVMVAQVANMTTARARWQETASGQAWQDPAMDYWRGLHFDMAVKDLMTSVGLTEGLPLLDSIQGQLLVAVELREKAADANAPKTGFQLPDVRFYAMADFGENAPKARELVAKTARGAWARPEGTSPQLPEITLHTDFKECPVQLCSAWVDETCVLASSPEAMKDLLSRRLKLKNPATPALAQSAQWKQVAKQTRNGADAWLYCNAARSYDVLTAVAERGLQNANKSTQWNSVRVLLETIGLQNLDQILSVYTMRGKAFETRETASFRGKTTGLLPLGDTAAPLRTPAWAREGIAEYSVARIRSPREIKDLCQSGLTKAFPEIEDLLEKLHEGFVSNLGVEPNQVLSALGNEFAMFTNQVGSTPDMALLWEIQDEKLLDLVLEQIRKTANLKVQKASFMSYGYEIQEFEKINIKIYTAKINGPAKSNSFLMVSTSDNWLKDFLKWRQDRADAIKSGKEEVLEKLAKPLLPELDKPFGRVPRKMRVVERLYSNPAPMLTQLNSLLPLLVPMVNTQLQASGIPELPSWVVASFPPLTPFAKQAFPTIKRVTQKDNLVVTEQTSSLDPLASPFSAAALVMVHKYWTGQALRAQAGGK
jgi:CRISPR/Cas system CSM-associated protein Csm2 small subunit